jgi:hypothetical protein
MLAGTIRELAETLGSPVFEPHVTLLSNLAGTEAEHVRRTETLAQRLHPLPIVLTAPSYGKAYFQCVFLPVEQTSQIVAANRTANEIFDGVAQSYFPHLSLVYGVFPEARKLEVVARLPASLCTAFDAAAVHLIKADSNDPQDWRELVAVPTTATSVGG